MKSLWKRLLCVAIALCMALQPVAYVRAEGTVTNETNNSSTVQLPLQVNPLYEGLIDEEDFISVQENQVAVFAEEEITYETDEAKMADQIRQTMIARDNLIELHFVTKKEFDESWFAAWFENAMAETDDSHAGDYLRWNWVTVGGENPSVWITHKDGMYYVDFKVPITYYTTYEQEEELDEKLNKVLKELEVLDSSKSDYEKTKAIYDYICSNVTYDYNNPDNLKYTAYAALINGTSVCQGYSALLYRMLEEADIDCRMVTGTGNDGDHGWNISELNGKYYYSDSTWDATYKQAGHAYGYFLKGTADFDEVNPSIEPHVPDENSFVYNEPYAAKLSETAYVPGEDSEDSDVDNTVNRNSVIVESISVDDDKVAFGETVVVRLNVYNPTDNTIEVSPDDWTIQWSYYNHEYEDNFLTDVCWSEDSSFELAAGEKKVITLYHYVDESESDGARTLWGIQGEEIEYVVDGGMLVEANSSSEVEHKLPYEGTADFTVVSKADAAEIESITLDTTEIIAGGTIPGQLVLKDKINTSCLILRFSSVDTEYTWYMYADDYELEQNGNEFTYQFNAKADTYVMPGKYQLEIVAYAKDEYGDSVGSFDCLEKNIFVTVSSPEGMVIIDNEKLVEESSKVLDNVESGETLVITDVSRWYYTVPAEFLKAAKDKNVKIIFAAADDHGEMILDPEKKVEEYEDFEFLFTLSGLNIVEGEDDWISETGVEAYSHIGVNMGQANIPFKIRVKQELPEGLSYYLFNYDDNEEKFVLVEKNLKCTEDGYVEIDFPNGLNEKNASSNDDGYVLQYYLGVKETTTGDCTKHVSDNRYTIVKESNCVEAGYESYHCIYCDVIIGGSERDLPLADHTWDEGVVTTPSTCSTEGVRKHICTLDGCGATKEEAEPCDESNHKYSWKYTIDEMATCTEGATLSIRCIECGEKHPELGCVEEGCEEEHPEVLNIETWPLGHKYKDVLTKATTKVNGKIESKCSVCGDVKKSTPIYRPYKMTLSTATYTYNGGVKTPSVTVIDSKGKALVKNVDYTVTYASGRKNVGKYAVKVTFKGNYSGTLTQYLTINPKGTSMSSVSKAKKAFTAKWKKQSTQVTGYQIQYSTSKNFAGAKTVTVSSYKTTSKKVTKLKAKKTYYVRVRTYKTVGSAKFYSGWSAAKSVKTK